MGIDDNLVSLAADLVVAEVFLYNKAITGSELIDLKNYINCRYARRESHQHDREPSRIGDTTAEKATNGIHHACAAANG